MAYCKKFLILFLILFILFFNFSSCFASEDVPLSQVNGITINSSANYFTSNSNANVKYFYAKKGFKYDITLSSGESGGRFWCSSETIPALNVPFELLGSISSGSTYSFSPSEDCYVGLATSNYWSVTAEEFPGINNSINSLVDNVGPNALWSVFGNGINFVFVVVVAAFGIFIIVKLIRGLSKGKSKV